MKCIPNLPLLFLLISGVSLAAQTPASEDKGLLELMELLNTPVNVSSTRASTVFTTPSTVSVIDRAQIERYGFQSLSEAIEIVSGIHMVRSIFHRDMPTSRGVLQESYANRVLLLIDGIATWHVMTGDAFPFKVDIEDIERIEVLRGPASVLYGTNAYAGAINVVTRRGEAGAAGRAFASALDQGGHRGGASYARKGDDLGFFISLTATKQLGETLRIKGEPSATANTDFTLVDLNRTRNANAAVQGKYFNLQANVFENTTPFFGSVPTYAAGGGKNWKEDGGFAHASVIIPLAEKYSLKFGATFDFGRRFPYISQDGATVLKQKGSRMTENLLFGWDMTKAFNLELGATHEKRQNDYYTMYNEITGTIISETGMKDRTQTEKSFSAQGALKLGSWNLQLGSRYTSNETFGNNNSSRVTVVYSISPKSSMKLIWGQSFRAPDFLAQFFNFRTTLGNEKLRPETSDSIELAYLAQAGPIFLQALVFHSRYMDKVTRVPMYPKYSSDPADNRVIYDNLPTFSANGIEVEMKFESRDYFSAFLNLDYTKGDRGDESPYLGPGYNYRFVPQIGVTAGISKTLAGFTGSLLVNHQSGVDGPLDRIPAWTQVNANLNYVHTVGRTRLRHTLALKNLGDQERWYPEYVRRKVNALPDAVGRQASYGVAMVF